MNEKEIVNFVYNLSEDGKSQALIQLLLYGEEARETLIKAIKEFDKFYSLSANKK